MWHDEPVSSKPYFAMNEIERPFERGDLLGGVLVHGVAVGHLDGRRVVEVDLVLALARLALRELDRHTGRLEVATDLADDVLVLRRLEDGVVLEVRRVRFEVAIALRVRLFVAVAEEVELDLGSDHRHVAQLGRLLHLAPQHLPRRHLDRRAGVDVEEIAHHERSPLDPRRDADRGGVDHRPHVAVPELVARELVPGNRVVVHVGGDEVVAVLGSLRPTHMVEVEPTGRALADETSLQIGEHHQHGVDVPRIDLGGELIR